MRNTVLVDTGIIVAALNRADRHHAEVLELLEGFAGKLLTTWPVVTEACALIGARRQRLVLEWLDDPDVLIVSDAPGWGIDPDEQALRAHPLH